MEYIQGQSLAERIKQGPIDAGAAVRLVATVAWRSNICTGKGSFTAT